MTASEHPDARSSGCRLSSLIAGTAASGLGAIAGVAGLDVLVELSAEVQALEDELEGGGYRGGMRGPELLYRRPERPHFPELAAVLARGHDVRDLDAQAALEGAHHLFELGAGEAAVEDVQHRALHELGEHLVLAAVAKRLHLDLAAR